MAESIVEQILAGFKTSLEAIEADDGTTAWNTFDKVSRCDVFSRDFLVPQYETIALIRDTGDDRADFEAAFGEETRELDVWIQVHIRDTRNEKDPHRASKLSGTLRNRLIQDVATKIMSDPRRGDLAVTTERGDELRDLYIEGGGWIGALMLFTVSYYHDRGSP